MMIDDAIRNAQSDRQVCALLMAYMDSLDPEMINGEQELQPGDIDGIRARFRRLIHALDKVSTRDSDRGPVIKQALHIYSEALSRLNLLSIEQQEKPEMESMPYTAGLMPRTESVWAAA